jgi:uncharacterized protein involved in outer membrane biogenesis
MPATEYDFTGDQAIEQGATWARQFVWRDSTGTPVNLTGYTARMQLRASAAATGAPLAELTTEDGTIVLGAGTGTVDLLVPAETTAGWTFTTGAYDLELEAADGTVTRLIKGRFKVSPEVTR